jgi:phage-related protein
MANVQDVVNQQLGQVASAVSQTRDYIAAFTDSITGGPLTAMTWAKWYLDTYGAEGINGARALLGDGITALRNYLGNKMTYINYGLSYTVNAVTQASKNLISIVEGLVASAGAAAYDFFSQKVDSLHQFIAQAFDVVISQVDYSINSVWDRLTSTVHNLQQSLNAQLLDISKNLLPAIDSVKDVVRAVVGEIPESIIKLFADTFLEEGPAES